MFFNVNCVGKSVPYCLHGKGFGLHFKDKYSIPFTFRVHIKVKLKECFKGELHYNTQDVVQLTQSCSVKILCILTNNFQVVYFRERGSG